MSDQTKKLNTYTSEFKESAVKLAIESDQSIVQTAKDLGVNPNTLHTWISKYSKPKAAIERTDEHIYDEIKRLKKELAKMSQERDLLKKATAYFAQEMLWIKKHSSEHPVTALCRFMNISRSCYCEWLDSPKTGREKENEELIEMLKILFEQGRGSYGTRRLKKKLAKQGIIVSRRRIGRLMSRAGLSCK